MGSNSLNILFILVVVLSFNGGYGQVFDVQLKNLLKMQNGIGWPPLLRVAKGHEALMRLSSTIPNMQTCKIITPAGLEFDVNRPPNNRYEQWGDDCGIRVKNVEDTDQGRWRLIATAGSNSITGWTELQVEEDTPSYTPIDPISLQDGSAHTKVELTSLSNSYCLVTQPFSDSSLVPGHCQVTLDRTTRAVQGRWNVVLGIPGRVSELEVARNVAVQSEQLVSGFREDSDTLNLYCNIIHTEKNITFCRFQKNSETVGYNIVDGLSDGRHSYFGEGFAKRQCGITIESKTADDYGTWRCTVGLQQWSGNTIKQSTPMQALIRVASRQSESTRKMKRADDDVRTLFVQRDSSFTISCRSDVSLAYCWFQHPNGTQFTPVQGQHEDESEYWYTGESLQVGDCGITFAHVTENDVGKWTCHMGSRNVLDVEITDNVYVRVTGPLAANKKEIAAYVGGEITLYCHTSNGPRPLEYCRFLTPDFVGINIDSTVTAKNAILGRFYFTPERSLDYGDCSLTIKTVEESDFGEWTCASVLHDSVVESRDSIVVYSTGTPRRPLSTAGIMGMVFGMIILAVALAITVWYKKGKLIPWRRNNAGENPSRLSVTFTQSSAVSSPRISNSSASSNEAQVQIRTSA